MSQSQDDPAKALEIHLVELAQLGDDAALTSLVVLHQGGVYGYLLGLVGNEEDALDLVQQTFLNASQKLLTLRYPSRFKPWLYRIARNLAYDHLRQKKKRSWLSWESLEEHEGVSLESNPEEYVTEVDFIKQALAQLPMKFRECLLLQVQGGFSQREIAALVGISEESVSTYVSNARRYLLQAYKRQEVELGISERRSTNLPFA